MSRLEDLPYRAITGLRGDDGEWACFVIMNSLNSYEACTVPSLRTHAPWINLHSSGQVSSSLPGIWTDSARNVVRQAGGARRTHPACSILVAWTNFGVSTSHPTLGLSAGDGHTGGLIRLHMRAWKRLHFSTGISVKHAAQSARKAPSMTTSLLDTGDCIPCLVWKIESHGPTIVQG